MNDPDVLDLIRQYGFERERVGGFTPDRGILQREKAQEALAAADALLARIAALVAQRPAPFVPEFPSRNPSTGEPWTREQFEALSAYWPLPSGEIPGPAQA